MDLMAIGTLYTALPYRLTWTRTLYLWPSPVYSIAFSVILAASVAPDRGGDEEEGRSWI